MHFTAVLNRDGGTMCTTDIDSFSATLRETLESSGHTVDIKAVAGRDLTATLENAARSAADVMIVAGGDGTVSAAAAHLKDSAMALAVLPAGTMNLFARSLGIPLSLDLAIKGFSNGTIEPVDIATANGKPFIHQFSVGMHARMIHLREKMKFASRWGKLRASARAAWSAAMNTRPIRVILLIDGIEIEVRTTAIGVSNNLFGEGHLPYADRPNGGKLGVYVTVAKHRSEVVRFLWQMARGHWKENDQVQIHECERVTLIVPRRRVRLKCAMDGELFDLEKQTEITIHPGALKVLVPGTGEDAKAA